MSKKIVFMFIGLLGSLTFAHSSREHGPAKLPHTISPVVLDQINNGLRKGPLTSLNKACFDCHSTKTEYPWYYGIPGIKQLIDSDIEEAQEHLVMSDKFPFKGSGNPIDDLEEMLEEIEEEKMPLPLYALAHPRARLSKQEKAQLIQWIKSSISLLHTLAQ